MNDNTIILMKILGKEKYKELIDFTLNNIEKTFGKRKPKEKTKLVKVNHQALLIISVHKARNIGDEKILELFHWKERNLEQYLVVKSLDKFISLYEDYINLILEFIKNN